MPLSPLHTALLDASGVAAHVRIARGYTTVHAADVLREYCFAEPQRRVPALLLPLYDIDGTCVLHQIRPDHPRTLADKVAKYEVPLGSTLPIDVPPGCRDALLNTTSPMFVVEGVRQADAGVSQGICCINTLGVGTHPNSNWRDGEKLLSNSVWNRIKLAKRRVFLAFSSSVTADPLRFRAVQRLAKRLADRGAVIKIVRFDPPPAGGNCALDDFLANGGTVAQLELAGTDRPTGTTPLFKQDDDGTWWAQPKKDGFEWVRLANFSARIAAELHVTDGIDEHMEFEIEVTLSGRAFSFTLPAGGFSNMGWVLPRMGAGAIVSSGYGYEARLREAIQTLSQPVKRVSVRQHVGWFEERGVRMFAHAGGIIYPTFASLDDPGDAEGDAPDGDYGQPNHVEVRQPTGEADQAGQIGPVGISIRPSDNSPENNELVLTGPIGPANSTEYNEVFLRARPPSGFGEFILPEPPDREDLVESIAKATRLLELGPDEVMLPLFASVFTAPLGATNFTVHLDGPRESNKSTRAALFQQFYGPGLNLHNLPGSFTSTTNALAAQLAGAKDVVNVIDDYRPGAGRSERARTGNEIDRLLRSQANRSGRARAKSDGSVRAGRAPTGLLICTGEAMPPGESLGTRILRLDCAGHELLRPPVTLQLLTECQAAASEGAFAKVLAGYLQWLAERPWVDADTKHRRAKWYETLFNQVRVPRHCEACASLLDGFHSFLSFALESGACGQQEYDEYADRFLDTIIQVLRAQRREKTDKAPATRFCELLAIALASGDAHMLDLSGERPDDPKEWGWRQLPPVSSTPATEESASVDPDRSPSTPEFVPRGTLIGYREPEVVYLIGDKALGVANRIARAANEELELSSRTLGPSLAERGYILNHRSDRYTTRVMVCGKRLNLYLLDDSAIKAQTQDLDGLEHAERQIELYDTLLDA